MNAPRKLTKQKTKWLISSEGEVRIEIPRMYVAQLTRAVADCRVLLALLEDALAEAKAKLNTQ